MFSKANKVFNPFDGILVVYGPFFSHFISGRGFSVSAKRATACSAIWIAIIFPGFIEFGFNFGTQKIFENQESFIVFEESLGKKFSQDYFGLLVWRNGERFVPKGHEFSHESGPKFCGGISAFLSPLSAYTEEMGDEISQSPEQNTNNKGDKGIFHDIGPDQNLRCLLKIVIMKNRSFYHDFFWKSMVFEGMRFQDFDT